MRRGLGDTAHKLEQFVKKSRRSPLFATNPFRCHCCIIKLDLHTLVTSPTWPQQLQVSMTAGRHCETKAKTFHTLFGYYPVMNIMSVHHCSFMSDNIVTFNEILTLLCHVPDSSASLQTMSNSLPEYYGARLKVPFQSSFLCHCHIGNVILLSLVTTLHGHQDSWDLRCWRHLTRLVSFLPHRLEII